MPRLNIESMTHFSLQRRSCSACEQSEEAPVWKVKSSSDAKSAHHTGQAINKSDLPKATTWWSQDLGRVCTCPIQTRRTRTGVQNSQRHARLCLGVVPGLVLLPVALLRVPPAALWRVHRQRARLVGEVRHVVYRLLHFALLHARAATRQVRALRTSAASGHRRGALLSHQQAWRARPRTSPGCLSVMPLSQPACTRTARLG